MNIKQVPVMRKYLCIRIFDCSDDKLYAIKMYMINMNLYVITCQYTFSQNNKPCCELLNAKKI